MLFQPDSGVCLAGRTVAALQRLARRDGASVRAEAPVLGIEPRGDEVLLSTAAGEVTARAAVIAAGPWAGGLLAGLLPQDPRLTVTVQQVRTSRRSPADVATLVEAARRPVLVLGPAVGGAPASGGRQPLARSIPPGGPSAEIDPAQEARWRVMGGALAGLTRRGAGGRYTARDDRG
jgi:glycine/D-amino acid oxidase-like deaminating enzyme